MDGELRAYFVWLPVLDPDDRPSALRHARRERDERVRHFWAPTRALAEAWARLHPPRGLPLAWDVVMLFDAGVRWRGATFPEPALVRYPESMSPEGVPPFDAAALRAAVERSLRTRSRAL